MTGASHGHFVESPRRDPVEAWLELGNSPWRRPPRHIERLTPPKDKSTVYRLRDIGPNGSAVIAKGASLAPLAREYRLYREVLPILPISSVECHGFLEGGDGFAWLFLEDAGDDPYVSERADHRALATEWLALMHTSAAGGSAAQILPSKGPDHYRSIMGDTRQTLLANLSSPALTAVHLETLRRLLFHYDALESHWQAVEDLCRLVPPTIAHADFSAKNIRVRTSGRRASVVLPFDWDNAYWGSPAVDLVSVDVAAYRSVARDTWPDLGRDEIRSLVRLGWVFNLLLYVDWDTWALPGPARWLPRPMARMAGYEQRLGSLLRAFWWVG